MKLFSMVTKVWLICTIAFLEPLHVYAESQSNNKWSHTQLAQSYLAVFNGDPLVKEFMEAPWAPPKFGPVPTEDPLLDQDPYFMRSQSWSKAPINSSNHTSVFVMHDKLSLQLPGQSFELTIKAGLKPLFETDDFLFFQASSREFFLDKAKKEEDTGEGIFFLNKQYIKAELERESDERRPVPIFFFPLFGTGWSGKISAIITEPFEVLALENSEGESIAIELEDIEKLSQILHNTVVLTTVMALKYSPETLQASARRMQKTVLQKGFELPLVLPPRGSTAAFGSFFTGQNLDEPEKAIYKTASRFEKFKQLILPKAHADGLISPDVLDRLMIVSGISLGTFVASVASKYTVFHEKMMKRRAYIEKREDEQRAKDGLDPKDRTTTKYKVVREFKEWIDVFSHGLAVASSGIGVAAGFLAEYGADRFLGKTGYSPNGMIRKFLELTFLYGRTQNELIAANWNSFYLGVLVLGGIDYLSGLLQLLVVSPVLFPWVAQWISEEMHQRTTHQFSGQDAVNSNIITSEIFRNLTAYFVSGAYAYSSSQRQALLEIVRPEVEAQMRSEGEDPTDHSPSVQKQLMERIEQRIEKMLVERGLPSRDEFIFSSPSLLRGLAQKMGYKVDRDTLAEEDKREGFLLENSRWGLINKSLKVALDEAETLARAHGDADMIEAAEMLRETKQEYNVVSNLIKNPLHPGEVLKKAYKVRKMLTILSYEGDVIGGSVKYVDAWDKSHRNPRAATIAARLYRRSLFSLVEGKPHYIKDNAQEVQDKLDQEEADAWKPPKKDWLARYQTSQAHKKAIKNKELDYKEAYRKALSEQVGLYTEEESPLTQEAGRAADIEIKNWVENNLTAKTYLSKLDEVAQVKFLNQMYANSFLAKYIDLSVSNSSFVSLTSHEQPGFFQKVRKKTWVKGDGFLNHFANKALRFLESPMDNTAYKPGIGYWLRRNVPWYQDWKTEFQLTARGIWLGMSIGYLTEYYLWQVKFPWTTALFFFLTGGLMSVIHWWIDRIMINMGIRPMHGTISKIKYGLVYTWLTYPTYMPFFFWYEDFNKTIATCEQFLTKTFSP